MEEEEMTNSVKVTSNGYTVIVPLFCERCGMPLQGDKKLDSPLDNELIVRPCENCSIEKEDW
jgi:RNase P subunit RPR2